MKPAVNPFVDITFSRSSSLALISVSLVLFEVILLSKSEFFTKSVISGISVLLAKFACFNLAAKFSDVNVLNS